MRLTGFVPLTIILILSEASFSQEWIEYKNSEEGFSINFPGEPTVQTTTYLSEGGEVLPARVYTTLEGPARYSVTVVDYHTVESVTQVRGSIAWAAWNFRKRGGEVTYDSFTQSDGFEGHLMQITNPDGALTYVAIHLGSKRLFIAEATVPAGYPPPADFQQSIYFVDESGTRVQYDIDYEGNKTLIRR